MLRAYKNLFTNYFNFSGRASIKDYWLAFAMNLIVAVILGIITGVIVGVGYIISEDMGNLATALTSGITGIYSLAIAIPFISLAVRRVHDQGRPGWIIALCYVGNLCCGLGGIAMLVFMCLPGTVGPNMYGPDPNGSTGYNEYNGYNNTNNQSF